MHMATAASISRISLSGAVTSLWGSKGAATVCDHMLYIILDLTQNATQAKIASVSVQDVLSGLSRESKDRGVDEECT